MILQNAGSSRSMMVGTYVPLRAVPTAARSRARSSAEASFARMVPERRMSFNRTWPERG